MRGRGGVVGLGDERSSSGRRVGQVQGGEGGWTGRLYVRFPLLTLPGFAQWPESSTDRVTLLLLSPPTVIHVSQILTFPPVRALSNTLMDVQRAVKLRDSHIIKVRVHTRLQRGFFLERDRVS